MDMYDSFLYGYGLSLAIFDQIKNIIPTNHILKDYLSVDKLIVEFLYADDHTRLKRDFYKFFPNVPHVLENHESIQIYLKDRIDEINKLGFEHWASRYSFSKEKQIPDTVLFYVYILYNYWYHIINEGILNHKKVNDFINSIGQKIQKIIGSKDNVFTTNFDTILDQVIKPQHLHGQFLIPLQNIAEMYFYDLSDNRFEYPYLFGTNGLEKFHRIMKIKDDPRNWYNFDFFFKDHDLGHLLIFGLSFGKAEVVSDNFLEEFPEHQNLYFTNSIDGHIIQRLDALYQKSKIQKLTVSYYSDEELAYLIELFNMTNMTSIINFKKSVDILSFNQILPVNGG